MHTGWIESLSTSSSAQRIRMAKGEVGQVEHMAKRAADIFIDKVVNGVKLYEADLPIKLDT